MIPWLLAASLAWGTQVARFEVPCPVGGTPTIVHELMGRNQVGWDSDGARYASQGQWRDYTLSTCPDNLLSLYSQDMKQGLTEAEQAQVEPVLHRFLEQGLHTESLQIWDRYALAAPIYEALGKEPLFLAQLHLRASWTIRDHLVGSAMGLQGPAHARLMLQAGEAELAKPLPPADKKKLLFNLAKIAHRLGLAEDRDRYVAEARKLTPHTSAEFNALGRFDTLPAAERAAQDRALVQLKLVEAGRGGDRVQATYLIADLYRRQGLNAEALERFEKVRRSPGAPAALRDLASYLAAELRGERPWERKDLGPDSLSPPPDPEAAAP